MATKHDAGWEEIDVVDHGLSYRFPFVSFYAGTMGFNVKFIELAQLRNYSFVNLLANAKTRQISLQFHNEGQRAGARLIIGQPKDGVPSKTSQRLGRDLTVSMRAVYKSVDWLNSMVAQRTKHQRMRYVPEYNHQMNAWIVTMKPQLGALQPLEDFLTNYRGSQALGVYALFDRQKQLIYIGEGNMRDRVKTHLSDDLEIEFVSCVALLTKQECREMENELLSEQEKILGLLPKYNRNAGHRKKGTLV